MMKVSASRVIFAVLATCGLVVSQTKFTNGPQVPQILAAALPTASTIPGQIFGVTDGATSGVCTGGGSTWVLCVSNGTTWQVAGSSPPAIAATFTAGSTSGTLTHNFGTADHILQCRTVSTGVFVFPAASGISTNSDVPTFPTGLAVDTRCVASR